MLRKRIKKKKPLLSFTKHKLLHSIIKSKSTYFYSNDGELSGSKSSNHIFPNRFKVGLSSSRLGSIFTESALVNRTRPSLTNKNLYRKNGDWRTSYILPAFCSIALLLVMGCMVNPFAQEGGEEVYAAINDDLGNGSTVSLAIYSNGTEVADDSTISTNVDVGRVSYISNTIKVTTNKIGKYYVGVQSATTSSDLTGVSTSATIAGVGSNVNTDSFGDNTWGYALTDNTSTADQNLAYSTLPAYSTSTTPQYASVQNPANGEHELKLTFAAKIRADKPADHYQTTALVSVAAEAKEVTTLSEITYMQDMSATICNNSEENETKQLIDKRDGKPYTIAKLKDKNCWMTQNLEIINKTISSTDSDMTSGSFAIPSPSISGFTSSDVAQPKAYYEAPYGGYYNWYTATAGAGTSSVSSGTLDQSICPKNWRLPPNTGSGSYSNLLTSYGTYQSGTLFYGDQSILASPLNFVRGGYVFNGSLRGAGSEGRYWSSTAYNASQAYDLYFSTRVDSYGYSDRFNGRSIRCVAR